MSSTPKSHPSPQNQFDASTQTLELELLRTNADVTPAEYYTEYYAALRRLSDDHLGHTGLV